MTYPVQRVNDVPLGMTVPDIAHAFAASGLFKDASDQAKAVTKIIAGRALGLDPFSAMSGLHVMQGKVEVGSHLIAGAIRRHPDYDYQVEAHTAQLCRVVFYRKGERIGVSEYTIADAESAGLTRNPTWKKHPKAMLFARAISSGYRYHAPDVFMAPVYSEGEIEDEPAPEPKPIKAEVVEEKPKRRPPQRAAQVAQVDADLPDPLKQAQDDVTAYAQTLPEDRRAQFKLDVLEPWQRGDAGELRRVLDYWRNPPEEPTDGGLAFDTPATFDPDALEV